MKNVQFQRYKTIKNQISRSYLGYDISNIISMDLISIVYGINIKKYLTIKDFLFFVKSFNLLKFKHDLSVQDGTLFTIGDYNRKDFYEILGFATSSVKNFKLFDFQSCSLIIKINLRNIIKAISFVSSLTSLSFQEKVQLAGRICFYFNVIDIIEKQVRPSAEKYCAFSSVHPLEAILVQYFKSRSVPTYSLQHGIYYTYKNNIPVDALAYENFNADFHFCWGAYTKSEFERAGISTDKLLIGGYPRKSVISKKIVFNPQICLVLLTRRSLQYANFELLDILSDFAKELNVKYFIKLHPSLQIKDYEGYISEHKFTFLDNKRTLTQLLCEDNFGWSISINSAAYYESYLNRVPCVRYSNGKFEDGPNILEDEFHDIATLYQCFNKIPFGDPNNMEGFFVNADKKLEYLIGLNVNNYSVLNSK